jgi:plasmid stability protein
LESVTAYRIRNRENKKQKQLLQRACSHRRPLEEEASLTLAAAVTPPELPDDLEAVLSSLSSLDYDALLRVSHSQPTVEDGILLDALIDRRRRAGLTPVEERWLAEIAERHDRVLVLRARAVALLHERGVDVSERVARA